MQKFTDCKNREWTIAIDPFLITKVLNEVKVLLTEWADNDFALAQRMRKEPQLTCAILYSVLDEQVNASGCKAAADAASCTVEREFARGMQGNAIHTALEALERDLANFSSSPEVATARLTLLDKEKELQAILGKKAISELENVDLNQAADRAVANSTSSASNSPDKSLSTHLQEE